MSDDKFDPAWEEVCTLPNGCTLYRELNEVGGHRYWSDEVGGGVFVWDTALVDAYTLLTAVIQEQGRIIVAQQNAYADQLIKPQQPGAHSNES